MRIAMAGLASFLAERGMKAVRHMRSLVAVASRAANLYDFVGMRKILDVCMAIRATEGAVDAGGMFTRINRDVFAASRRHSGLAVAGKAAFILLQWLGGFWLSVDPSRSQCAD